MDALEKNYLLKMKDMPVLRFNIAKMMCEVYNESYIPYQLRNAIEYDTACSAKNYNAFLSYLSSRTLPMSRENAKKIHNALGMSQAQDPQTRARFSLAYNSISLQDNFWVHEEKERKSWSDVDIRQNKLSRVLSDVALHGYSVSIQGTIHTPEVATNGAYAKGWRREDGKLYLFKKGYNNGKESQIEVSVSNILDKCNVKHVKYHKVMEDKTYYCKCECMTNQKLNILPACDFISYCTRLGLDWKKEVMRIDSESMYKMFIVDYLISNTDRHNLNWGFFFDCDTMQILGCHPLFDHNNSFSEDAIKNDSLRSLVIEEVTMRSLALRSLERVDFHFTSKIKRSDFVSGEHYKSFKRRSEYLGLW